MPRELSTDALRHQLDAFCSYAARTRAASFELWMELKDFAPADRTALRRLMRNRHPQGM